MSVRRIAVMAFGAAMVAGLLAGCGSKNLDLADYTKIVVEGPNGYAAAHVELDRESLGRDLWDLTEHQDSYNRAKDMNSYEYEELQYVLNDIETGIDLTENISNGDVINATAEIDPHAEKDAKVSFNAAHLSEKVENLEDPVSVDPFENVTVSFEGTQPSGEARIDEGTNSFGFRYSLDRREGLSNGETVSVTAEYDEAALIQQGCIVEPENTTKEYTVEGLDRYLMDISEVDSAVLEEMKSYCLDDIEADYARKNEEGDWANQGIDSVDENIQYSVPELIGNYTLTRKPDYFGFGGDYYTYLVFEGTVSDDVGDVTVPENTVVYYVFELTGIKELGNGSQTYDPSSISRLSGDGLEFSAINWPVDCYTSGVGMYNDIVVKEKDDFDYYVSDGLKQFGE